jgi:hypothetical protein
MSHTSEKRWNGISSEVEVVSGALMQALNNAEEAYQRMQEIYIYAGGTAADLAELLFKEDIAFRSSPDNVANAEEIAKATDAIASMTAAHELYQAANNIAVTQSDRVTNLRRMI